MSTVMDILVDHVDNMTHITDEILNNALEEWKGDDINSLLERYHTLQSKVVSKQNPLNVPIHERKENLLIEKECEEEKAMKSKVKRLQERGNIDLFRNSASIYNSVVFYLDESTRQEVTFHFFSETSREISLDLFVVDIKTNFETFSDIFSELIHNTQLTKICFSWKSFLRSIEQFGTVPLTFPISNTYDPQIGAYLLNQDSNRSDLNLKQLVSFFQIKLPASLTLHPNLHKSVRIWLLWRNLEKRIISSDLWTVFEHQEMPVSFILFQMESYGICFNKNHFQSQLNRLRDDLRNCRDQAVDISGKPFNLQSPDQVSHILFDHLKLKSKYGTSTNKRSTSMEFLKSIENEHPIIPFIIEHRILCKLLNSYYEPLSNIQVLPISQNVTVIQTEWNQIDTCTGRLSSSNPNLQNLPQPHKYSQRYKDLVSVRQAFQCRTPSGILLSADYSQMEVRVMASLSGDTNLIALFASKQDVDVYKLLASCIFSKHVSKVTIEERACCKTITLGILYGMGVHGMAKKLSSNLQRQYSRSDANHILQMFFKRFPDLKTFQDENISMCSESGYIRTTTRRRRYLPDINSTDASLKARSKRQAVNTVIQGTSSDIVKQSMIMIQSQKIKGLHLIMQIHDEIVFELDDKTQIDQVCPIIQHCMQSVPDIVSSSIRFPIQFKIGNDLENLSPFEVVSDPENSVSKPTHLSKTMDFVPNNEQKVPDVTPSKDLSPMADPTQFLMENATDRINRKLEIFRYQSEDN